MRYVSTRTIQPGAVLGRELYNDKGRVLLSEGVVLSETLIQKLLEIGIPYVYIKDSKTEDLFYEEAVPRELKTKAIMTIEDAFAKVQKASIPVSITVEQQSKKFTSLIREIYSQIKSNDDLLALISDVFTYDNYIFTHSFNVTLYSMAIGMELGLTEKQLEVLGLGAIFHDVGKMKVPTNILFKPGKLTEEEFEVIKKHPQDGFDILRNVQTISLIVAHCAYQHHERMNGTGYPRGLKGDEIHYYAKIIGVADVFDAVTSDRVYRGAMLPQNGLDILFAGSGTLFDEEIVKAFRRSVVIYPVGLTVELSDGRKGVICGQNKHMSDRPLVRVLEENGQEITPYEIDLLKELSVVIVGCDTNFKNKE